MSRPLRVVVAVVAIAAALFVALRGSIVLGLLLGVGVGGLIVTLGGDKERGGR